MASIDSTSIPDPPLACPEVPGIASRDTPFSLALKGKLTREKTYEFHRAVTAFVVKAKGYIPSQSFRYARLKVNRVLVQ